MLPLENEVYLIKFHLKPVTFPHSRRAARTGVPGVVPKSARASARAEEEVTLKRAGAGFGGVKGGVACFGNLQFFTQQRYRPIPLPRLHGPT